MRLAEIVRAVVFLGFVAALVMGCGQEVAVPTSYSTVSNIPLDVRHQRARGDLSAAADKAYEKFVERFGVAPPTAVIVAVDYDSLKAFCGENKRILHGCTDGTQIYINAIDTKRMCDTIIHELGHLHFLHTESNGDHDHERHSDFFHWAYTACELESF